MTTLNRNPLGARLIALTAVKASDHDADDKTAD